MLQLILHVSVGDYVIITEGAFNDMSGKVVELDHEKQKLKWRLKCSVVKPLQT